MPFGADTPTPRICRKFTREGGAVSARHTRGSDHPLGGHTETQRRAHRPARRLRQSKAVNCARPRLLHGKAEKRRPADFTRAKSESPVPGWTFPEQSPKVCRPVTFPEQSGKVCPPGLHQSKVRKRKPGGRCARRAKKPGFPKTFFRRLRAYISGSAASFFAKKELDFFARRSD